jgi:hypothetical protein
MVEIIGLVTMGALTWVLTWSLAGESDAERRRISAEHRPYAGEPSPKAVDVKQAA